MNRYSLWSLIFCVSAFIWGATTRSYGLDAEQQAVIDAYKKPFEGYIAAVNLLNQALQNANTDADVVVAADKFCDSANDFVDQFNDVRDRYRGSDILKSMDNDADAKKAVNDLMGDLKKKMEESKPTFDKLVAALNKYASSSGIKRVRDRLAATFQRVQLITF